MLDGGRLMKIGTNEWQSEQGFIKVKKETDSSLSVRYPNGSKARYETSPSAPFSYVMILYTSRNGRSVKYLYEQADRLPYIRKVMYGESNGVYNDSIVFTYRDVEAPITHYIDNLSFKHSRLLEKVESFYKGRLWKRYKLSYENRDVNLPVQLDCETDNGRLRPLQFKYGVGRSIEFLSERSILLEKYFKNSVQGPGAHKSLALSRGKFSRNAQSDGLISYPLLGNYAETQQLLVYKDLSDTYVAPVVFTAGKGFKQLEALDINGDGLEEPVKVNYADSKLSVSVYTNEIDPNRHSDYTYTEGSGYVHERQIISGDFNGDGKVELLAISSCYDSDKRKHPSRALLIDLNNRQTLYDGECFDFTLHQVDERAVYPDRMLTMDYNGDGKTDICVINVYGLYVYEFSGKGFYQLAYSDAINIMHFNFESNTSKDRELMVADMNGDGSMDIVLGPRRVHCKDGFKHLGDGLCHGACADENNLVSTSASGYKRYVHPYSKQECTTDPSTPVRDLITFDWNVKDGKQWTFLISTGNSSYSREKPGFKVHTEELFYCFHETVGLNFMLMDIDNDGLPDLLRNARGKIYLHLNKNGKISQEYNYRSVLQMDNPSAQFAVANVAQSYYWSGSLICVDNEKLHTYHYNHNESKERLLHELKDSYGITSKHYYMDLMEMSGNNYISQPDASLEYISYPYTIMTPHLFVPSWTKKVQSGKDLSWEYYTYTHAVFHRTGLGFRGFRKIQTKDAINNRTMISVFDPELLCAETRKETPTDTITRTYVLERAQNKTALLKLMKETVKDALNGTEKSTSYEYNAYGQPTSTSTSQGIRLSDNQTSDYLNVENDDIYLLGLPLFKQKQTVRRDSVFTQAYGRLKTQREEAPDGVWLQKEYTYTTDGLPASIAYSSQNGVLTTEQLTYRNGFLTEVQLTDGTIVYRHDEENERGQLTKLTTGTMQRLYEFDEWGLPVRRSITKSDRSILLDQRYQFDVKTGNLTKRTDAQRNLVENFGYDALNRLTSYGNYSVTYGDNGNILRKGDAGELAYTNPNRPYAVTGWSPTDQQKAPDETSITYTAGERPSIIRQEAKQAVLTYNAQHDRVRMQYAVNDSIRSTHYYLSGNYEMKKTLADMKEILYLGGGYYEAPAVYVKEGQKTDIYFIHRDYLGSILQLADRKGNLVEENSFDAWGCRRNPATQQPYAEGKAPELLLGRGFTGHEHLSFFGLVNMNARLYDPLLGRFLSPDPYVQFLDYTQAFNRYSYCMNSPLCYVDESGEIWFLIAGALIGAYVGASIKSHSLNPKHWTNDWWKGALIGGLVGAVAGQTIGTMWANGATISFGVSGSSFYVPIITFTPSTATAASITAVTIGGGLGIWSGISIPLGNKQNNEHCQETNETTPNKGVIDMIEKWEKKKKHSNDSGPFNYLDYTGFALSQASITVYSPEANQWMGKNKKMYNFNFNGNKYTGGRINYAKQLATKLDYAVKGIGAINIGMSWNEYRKGNFSLPQAIMDTVFGIYSSANSKYGTWTGIWYNLGKEYGPIHKYLKIK